MKLSIITVNYNHVEGLKKTIDSILSQTWKDFEWIVIDGGSTDGSKELIEQYKNHMSYWCSEPDNGVYNAQNKGLEHATGEYVNFMNSGDIFAHENTLSIVFNGKHSADIIYGYMMRKSSKGIPHNIFSMKRPLFWEDFYFDTLPHQSSYIKKELFNKFGKYDETYKRLADWKWFALAIAHKSIKTEFLQEKLSIYECGGISEDPNWVEELYRLREEMYPAYISATDMEQMHFIHCIYKHWWSKLAYRILRRIVITYENMIRRIKFLYIRYCK